MLRSGRQPNDSVVVVERCIEDGWLLDNERYMSCQQREISATEE
jgi:hypothetical protein